ncbi:MAG TPA: cupin domain-containing protein [Candidatus Dormibacteraeota bacterium]|nr:cupin domain-containing protein [Candidatus Dormibacteraeota bacterium]
MATELVEPKKINVLAKAKSEKVFVPKSLGKVGDVTLELALGDGELPFWHTNDEDEHVYCVRGTIHYQLKKGEEELPSVDVNEGDLFVIPAGVAHKPVCSPDNVVLIMEKVNAWTTFDE